MGVTGKFRDKASSSVDWKVIVFFWSDISSKGLFVLGELVLGPVAWSDLG